MKRLVCVGVCLITLGAAATAGAQSLSAGIKAGVAISGIKADGIPGFDPDGSAVPSFGGWVSIGLGSVVRIQPELLVHTRHATSFVSFPTIEVTSRSYDVPMLVVARLRPKAKAHPLLFLGPFVGGVSHVTQRAAGVETDISRTIRNMDAGVTFGTGVEIAARRRAVVLETRVSIGLRNLSENPAVSFRSRGFMAFVGYRF